MRPAYTHALVVPLKNPYGLSINDVRTLVNGRNRAASFIEVGDTIDLTQVDLVSYVRSSLTGNLLDLERSGTVRRVMQEVPEKLFDALANEIHRQQLAHPIPEDRVIPGKIIHLEPGVQVAIGTGDLAPRPNPGESVGQQIEVGMTGPPSSAPQPESTPADTTSKIVPKKEKAQAPVTAPATATEKTWKSGKSFKDQESLVKNSSDPRFLNQVIADPGEKRRIILTAKKRLKSIQ